MRISALMCVLAAGIAAAACDEKLSTVAGPTPSLEPTFASVQSQIFETTDAAGRTACVTCHTNVGRTPSGGLNLAHDVAYDQLINVSSPQVQSMKRVNPRR